jgi:hypothetical protein
LALNAHGEPTIEAVTSAALLNPFVLGNLRARESWGSRSQFDVTPRSFSDEHHSAGPTQLQRLSNHAVERHRQPNDRIDPLVTAALVCLKQPS